MTDNLPTVDDFATYPHMTEEATARRLAKYMAVEAHWSASLNSSYFKAMMAEESGSDYPNAAACYHLNQALMTAEHSVAFLLRALMHHLPDKADEIAAELWSDWEDPPVVAQTWPVLESFGIDPKAVQDAALKRFHAVKGNQALPAESDVHPNQTSLPSGGES